MKRTRSITVWIATIFINAVESHTMRYHTSMLGHPWWYVNPYISLLIYCKPLLCHTNTLLWFMILHHSQIVMFVILGDTYTSHKRSDLPRTIIKVKTLYAGAAIRYLGVSEFVAPWQRGRACAAASNDCGFIDKQKTATICGGISALCSLHKVVAKEL